MHRIVILGLGSNLGDRLTYLRDAVSRLENSLGAAILSGVYESASFFNHEEPNYLNICAGFHTSTEAENILHLIHVVEQSLGRPFPRLKDRAPRTIDIDFLWSEEGQIDQPDLIVPHPGLWDRPFFLVPLVEVHPAAICPIRKLGYSEHLKEIDTSGVYFIGKLF